MIRFFKRVLIVVTVLLVLLLVLFGIAYSVYNRPVPEGLRGPAADALAEKTLTAVNQQAYDTTRFLEWSFQGGSHHYKWDKMKGEVEVKWDDYVVVLELNDPTKSTVSRNGTAVRNEDRQELIAKATQLFNNDSFWLVAPFKVFDKGTTRSIVILEDGTEALLVNYSSGGTTPGDTYLWKLLPNGFPESYRMWVQIIPIGGLEASWDDWKIMENGLALPVSHAIGPMKLKLGPVRAYN